MGTILSKSLRELTIASEVKRNCGRVTDRGEEACSEDCELMNKNRIRGDAEQGERANDREALMVESSGCV